jgi:hypothetical protein
MSCFLKPSSYITKNLISPSMFQIKLVNFTSIYVILLHKGMIIWQGWGGKIQTGLGNSYSSTKKGSDFKSLSIQH